MVAIYQLVVAPHVAHPVLALLVTLAIAVPVSVVAARLFAAVFEIPFQSHRSWGALKATVRARLAPQPAQQTAAA
jgi:hypothetical protein